MIEKTVTIELCLSPNELAKEFCEMNANQQVLFFNSIAEHVKEWDAPFAIQCQGMYDEKLITEEGKNIIEKLWDYLA